MTITTGAVLALTGTGSFYGKTMSRGLDLAAKHIEAAGGPKISYIYLDHKSGDAAAGKAAITELGSKNVAVKFASYVDDLGAMLDGTAQYKMFTLDGGGGTSTFGQGKPYFWGTRAITPERPDAGPVPVHEGHAARRQDDGHRGLGPRRAEQQQHQGRHPEEDQRRRLHPQRAVRVRPGRRAGLLPGAPQGEGQRARHPAREHLRPGPRLVRQPGGDGRPQGHACSTSSSPRTA